MAEAATASNAALRPPRPLSLAAADASAHDVAMVRLGRASSGQFRRSRSKPEHPTSNMAAAAVAAENRGKLRQSCQQLVLLRNFSVCEQDIVICNRVRCGLDPGSFQDRDGADPGFKRSLGMEEARVAALLRRRLSVSAIDAGAAGEADAAPGASAAVATVATGGSANKRPTAAFGAMPPLSLASEPDTRQQQGAASLDSSNSPGSSVYSSATSDSGRVTPLGPATSDEEDDDVAMLQDTLRRHMPTPGVLKKPGMRMRAASESALTLKARIKKSKGNPFNRYLIRDPFANGAYGKVCAGQDNASHQEVAVKIVPKSILVSPEEKQSVVREQAIHQTLNHPHIIKLIDVFEDEGAHYFVLERADAGALTSVMTCAGMDEGRCRDVFGQLLLALEYLHLHHIVHHDIKPHNVLLHANGSIKLCDFGASRAFEPGETTLQFTGIFGTPGYIAPELLNGDKEYSPAVDMFSAGILLFEMVFGYAPFYPPSACTHELLEFPYRCTASAQVQDLLCRLMDKDPSKRLTASQALGHPWITMGAACRSAPSSPVFAPPHASSSA